jgi:hypothetical protein
MTAWKLPLIVAAIVVPVVAAFSVGIYLVGGPAFGIAAGALVAVVIIIVAARQRPRGPIGTPGEDGRRHILLVVTGPVEEPAAVRRIGEEANLHASGATDVMVLAPARIGFLDRWASDVEGARHQAQRNLVVTVAALARAGIEAEARVGDEDFVQAVEDQLQSFPANEVVLVSAGAEDGDAAAPAAEELRSRLRAKFEHVVL